MTEGVRVALDGILLLKVLCGSFVQRTKMRSEGVRLLLVWVRRWGGGGGGGGLI